MSESGVDTNAPVYLTNSMIDFKTDNINKFIPLRDRVVGKLVKDARKETKVGSIILTSNTKEPYSECEVLSVGRGVTTSIGVIPPEVAVGDICLLWTGKWFELTDGDNQYIIFQENDIVAKYRPVAPTSVPITEEEST